MSGEILPFPGPQDTSPRQQALLAQAYRFAARNPRFAYAGLDRLPGLTVLLFSGRTGVGGFAAHVRENGTAHACDENGAFLAGGKSLESVLARVAGA